MASKFSFFRKRNAEVHEQPDEEEDRLEGERAMPSVNKGLTMQAKATNYLLFGLVIFLAVFVLYKYYASLYDKKKAIEQAGKVDTATNMVSVLPPLTTLPPPPPAPAATAAGTAPAGGVASTDGAPPPPPPAGQGAAGGAQQPRPLTPAEKVFNRRLDAPVMFQVSSGSAGNSAAQATPGQGAGGAAGGQAAAGGPLGGGAGGAGGSGARSGDGLSEHLQGAYLPGVQAGLMPDRNFIIAQSAHVECTMPEAIDSTQPGMVSCVQAQDVFSDNGAVVLLEKGTVYTGQMKRALLNGQRRAFLLWTRAKTPKGVVVQLDSPAADELGRSGITGEVDTHFWERFGSAIMVSLIDDIGTSIVANQSKGSGSGNSTVVAFPQTVQGSQTVMGDVLKLTGDIPPTLTKQQGATVNIYVARDLDFRSVYGLREKM